MGNDHHMRELIDLIEHFLPLDEWHFLMSAQYIYYSNKWDTLGNAQNYQGLGYPLAFYNSKKCRIRVEYLWNSREFDRSIDIKYGRLETPDKAGIVLSSVQEKDYPILWHSVFYALDFLDGLSPQEAKNASRPRLLMEFEQSDLAKSIKSEPEKDVRLHAAIWETHGQSLFDIFDVQNKELWIQYSAFVREFWNTLPQV
jgi:hypothetical protein